MRAEAAPYARFQRALDAGNLKLAELEALACDHLDAADTLRLLLLMIEDGDERYERAAVRWLGLLLSECPTIGFDLARQALDGLRCLNRGDPGTARTQLAVVLRAAGDARAAEALGRGAARRWSEAPRSYRRSRVDQAGLLEP